MKRDPSVERRARDAALLFVYAGASPRRVRLHRDRARRAVRRREREEALQRSRERSRPAAGVLSPPGARTAFQRPARGLPGLSDEAVERGFWLVLSLLAFWLMVGAIFAVGAFP